MTSFVLDVDDRHDRAESHLIVLVRWTFIHVHWELQFMHVGGMCFSVRPVKVYYARDRKLTCDSVKQALFSSVWTANYSPCRALSYEIRNKDTCNSNAL